MNHPYSLDSSDYEGRMGRLSFESGSTAGTVDCVDVGIIDDVCKERNESFVFALCAGGDPSVHIDDFYSDVYIIDNDGKLSKCTYIYNNTASFSQETTVANDTYVCYCISFQIQLYRFLCQLEMVV